MKTTIVWLIAALLFAAVLVAESAECHDCVAGGTLCNSPDQCNPGCQCIPLPGRNVGLCQ